MKKENQNNKDNKQWLSIAQAKLEQELYNQMHNEWVHLNGCGNKDCLICNSLKK